MKKLFTPLLILAVLLSLIAYTAVKISQLFNFITLPFGWMIAILIFALMIVSELIYHKNSHFASSIILRSFAWIGSIIMGLWTTFILLSLITDFISLLFLLIDKFSLSSVLTYKIEVFLKTWSKEILLPLSVLLVIIGLWQAAKGPKIKQITIPLDCLPSDFTSFNIVQISDLHVGLLIRKKYLEKLVQLIAPLCPDIIVFTGDLADGTHSSLHKELQPLNNLKAQYGKYFVTGNHEYYWGVESWLEYVTSIGFIPLINENRILNIKGATILLAGIPDPTGNSFSPKHYINLKQAIFTSSTPSCKILLAHNPSIYPAAKRAGFDLQLSGHTHAGQFFPFNLLLPLAHKYRHGLHKLKYIPRDKSDGESKQLNKMWLYINAGTGTWGPYNRLGISSEITVIKVCTSKL